MNFTPVRHQNCLFHYSVQQVPLSYLNWLFCWFILKAGTSNSYTISIINSDHLISTLIKYKRKKLFSNQAIHPKQALWSLQVVKEINPTTFNRYFLYPVQVLVSTDNIYQLFFLTSELQFCNFAAFPDSSLDWVGKSKLCKLQINISQKFRK